MCDEAEKAIQEAYEAKKTAMENSEEADYAVEEIKKIIGENGGDGDCHEAHLEKAD
jgi:hypothetical protein